MAPSAPSRDRARRRTLWLLKIITTGARCSENNLLRQITALAKIQCTQKEAAKVLLVSHRLLVKFLAEHAEAREAWKRGRAIGDVSLRRLLWKQAQHDAPQARFLAKHWLKMDEKPRQRTGKEASPVRSDKENTHGFLSCRPRHGDCHRSYSAFPVFLVLSGATVMLGVPSAPA